MIDEEFDYPHEIEDDGLFQIVGLGNEVQNFLKRDTVGKYIWARARQDRVTAISEMEELNQFDPDFQKKYHAATMKVAAPKLILHYLQEAFNAAAQAERTLTDRDLSDPQ